MHVTKDAVNVRMEIPVLILIGKSDAPRCLNPQLLIVPGGRGIGGPGIGDGGGTALESGILEFVARGLGCAQRCRKNQRHCEERS